MSTETPSSPDDVATFADADRYLAELGDERQLTAADALACLVADALRQRRAIDPQTYVAVYANPDYVEDRDLRGDLKLTDRERMVLAMVAAR